MCIVGEQMRFRRMRSDGDNLAFCMISPFAADDRMFRVIIAYTFVFQSVTRCLGLDMHRNEVSDARKVIQAYMYVTRRHSAQAGLWI